MSTVDAVMRTLHLLVGSAWVGSVLFVTFGVLPFARDGELNATPLERIVGRLTTVSRGSSLVMLLSGGHLAAAGYTLDSTATGLFGSTRGHLVLAMVLLWLVLTALVEVGASRMGDGFAEKKVRAPAREHSSWFQLASVVGVLLLVDAALISTGLLSTLGL
jgi:uncharacterized membrane protein